MGIYIFSLKSGIGSGYEDIALKNGDNAYYSTQQSQFDGERGWTSPIWVYLIRKHLD